MNVRLLRKIKKHILAEPRRFVMWAWLREKETSGDTFTSDANDNRQVKFAKCGTAACIAGWTCILAGDKHPYDHEESARELLEVDEQQSKSLFILDRWPEEFRYPYQKAVGQRTMVKIAANRIEHFIKTGE